ncbi:MAG: hypothetical protein V1709_00390 [Planctomycetota bacterium]
MEKPKPEEFGITEEQFDAIEESSNGIVRRIAVAGIRIMILAVVALIAYRIFAPYSETATTVVDTITDGFYIIIGGTMITILIIELYLFCLKMVSPIYKKADQYKTAMKDYEKQLRDDARKFGNS